MPRLAKTNTYYKIQTAQALTVTDIMEGTAQLTASGVLEVTELVEAVHKEIVLHPFKLIDIVFKKNKGYLYAEFAYEQTTGRVYTVIKSLAKISGSNAARTLRFLDANLPSTLQHKKLTKPSQLIVSAVNGLMGDHLVKMNNPLALQMHLCNYRGNVHHLQNLSDHLIIFVHGLCLNYLCWNPKNKQALGKKAKKTFKGANILYLNYNTGRRISDNGEDFSQLLAKVMANNPQIKRIDIIGHSMGGLVARSAMYYGEKQKQLWLKKMHNYIALCSPHHGALLERIGFFIQDSLSRIPVAGNFSRLGNLRSAGIIDLRYGNVRHEDWQHDIERIGDAEDSRTLTPLPEHVTTYLVAATIDSEQEQNSKKLLGDGLVSVASALGECYVDYYSYYNLKVPEKQKIIFYDMHHMNVLYDTVAHRNILQWLLE